VNPPLASPISSSPSPSSTFNSSPPLNPAPPPIPPSPPAPDLILPTLALAASSAAAISHSVLL
ncbi:MAG: hypothetical protein Q9180_009827, partial [Flavoplaca navasiana]